MMRSVTAALLTAAILGAPTSSAQTDDGTQARLATPIVAHLYADPAAFAGRAVMIYGLVVESDASGTIFSLQDVSLHPLKIVGGERVRAAVGDQVTVIGIFHADHEPPHLAASALIPTRVLAGGGCC
jgi:hypothetical protein